MADPVALRAVRIGLRVLPAPVRERTAARLFLMTRDHGEPDREKEWRERGEAVHVAGMEGTAFGPADGRVILLLHGWEGRGLQLSAYIDPLVEAGHRVIALDAPGHGRTPGDAGLPTWTDAMEEAIRSVAPVGIVAHSFGAATAVIAAARTDFDGRLVCLGGPPETQEMFDEGRAMLGLGRAGQDLFVDALRRRFAGRRFDDLLEVGAAAARLHCDCLAINGDQEERARLRSAEHVMAEARGQVLIVPGVAHRNVMWEPQAVEPGVRFLLGD